MLIYALFIFVCIVLLLLYYRYKNRNVILLLYSFVIFFAGFRVNVGVDYGYYYVWFFNKTRDENIEIGFLFLMNFFRKYLFNNFYLFIFFITLVTYTVFFFIIRKFSNCILVSLLFFLLYPPLFLSSLTFVRQFLAVACYGLFFYFYSKYKKRNSEIILSAIVGVISVSFHYSALLALLLLIFISFFIKKYVRAYQYFLVIWLISLFFCFGFLYNILEFINFSLRYPQYDEYIKTKNPISFFNIIYINIFAFYILLHKKKFHSRINFYLIFFVVIEAIITNFFSFNRDVIRMLYYFRIFEIILLTNIVVRLTNRKKIVILITIIFTFAFYRAIVISEIENKDRTTLLPYKNLFLNIDE